MCTGQIDYNVTTAGCKIMVISGQFIAKSHIIVFFLSLQHNRPFVCYTICGSSVGAGDVGDAFAFPRNFFGKSGKYGRNLGKIWTNLDKI